MQREIKFRGKRIDTGEWVTGLLDNYQGKCYINHEDYSDGVYSHYSFEVNPLTVGQYTGLKYKNGVEVFEGDIVKGKYFIKISQDPDAEDKIMNFEGVIEYEEGFYYVKAKKGNCSFSFTYPDYEIETIGNIHDNPELI